MSKTIFDVLAKTAGMYPGEPAVYSKQNKIWQKTTWGEYSAEIYLAARAFAALGLAPGDFVTILSINCKEWVVANLGAIGAGAVPAGIYPTSSPEQCEYIINHCGASVVVVEDDKQLAKINSIRANLLNLKFIVKIKGESDPKSQVYGWKDFLSCAEGFSMDQLKVRLKAQKPTDLATLVYTSGTTASPKAVMLSHENLTWVAEVNTHNHMQISKDDVLVSYLPLSHVAEQMTTIHGPLFSGACVWFAESLDKASEAMIAAEPTLFLGVPRVWEKIQAKMIEKTRHSSLLKQWLFRWARGVGLDHGTRMQDKNGGSVWFSLANKLVFSKVKKALGLRRCRMQVTAAAPIAKETLEFFLSLDIPLYEIFGMSECTGPGTISMPGQYKLGKTGVPLIGSQVKIAEDGEILLRGQHVFMGYLHDPGETKKVIDAEGWLHTGDLGEFDEEGYLAITGRKKNLIITAGGENIAPELLENKLKTIPGVDQAVVIGDRRKYLGALVTLSPDAVHLGRQAGSPAASPEELASCDVFNKYLKDRINELNQTVARVQTIKAFSILPQTFSEESGELTPTMKVKRSVVMKKFEKEIESLY